MNYWFLLLFVNIGYAAEWTEWSTCSTSCNIGTRSRQLCISVNNCTQESQSCNTGVSCDLELHWGNWTNWLKCSHHTGCWGGVQSKSRECYWISKSLHNISRSPCLSRETEDRSCNEIFTSNHFCSGRWTNWSGWFDCNIDCSNAKGILYAMKNGVVYNTIRYRKSIQLHTKLCNGIHCYIGSPYNKRQCNIRECYLKHSYGSTNRPTPAIGKWSAWGKWTFYSPGTLIRRRVCQGSGCVGPTLEFSKCATNSCLDELKQIVLWFPWTPWTECDPLCGGVQTRTRSCKIESSCEGQSQQTKFCPAIWVKRRLCLQKGMWSEWTRWSNCSECCGLGETIRTRICESNNPQSKIICEGETEQKTTCNLTPCRGAWEAWGAYSGCSVTCGSGVQEQVRQRRVNAICLQRESRKQGCTLGACSGGGTGGGGGGQGGGGGDGEGGAVTGGGKQLTGGELGAAIGVPIAAAAALSLGLGLGLGLKREPEPWSSWSQVNGVCKRTRNCNFMQCKGHLEEYSNVEQNIDYGHWSTWTTGCEQYCGGASWCGQYNDKNECLDGPYVCTSSCYCGFRHRVRNKYTKCGSELKPTEIERKLCTVRFWCLRTPIMPMPKTIATFRSLLKLTL